MSKTPPITVVAACVNEARQASEWIDHLQWVDRVQVVDTGSIDGTPEILRARGVEVEPYEGGDGGIIHGAKNQALARVTEGWILDLDFDERVTLALRDEIRRRISAPADSPAPDGYRIPFRHYVLGRWLRHGGWNDRHLRLYRAGRARYGEDRAHSALRLDGAVGDLEGEIVHFAHPTLHDFIVKMNRYTSEDAPLIRQQGRGGLRNRAPLPPRPWKWARASASVFWNRYVKSGGFRDGAPGLLIAALMSAYVFVEAAKVWELGLGESGREPEPS